jgi:hypothetical protein
VEQHDLRVVVLGGELAQRVTVMIIAKAKKRAPTMSHSAWKLPIPSPIRSNQPSVRMASSETTIGLGMKGFISARRSTIPQGNVATIVVNRG